MHIYLSHQPLALFPLPLLLLATKLARSYVLHSILVRYRKQNVCHSLNAIWRRQNILQIRLLDYFISN